MRARASILGLCAFASGCSFDSPVPSATDGGTDGKPIDAPDAATTGFCVGRVVQVCTPAPPPPSLAIGARTIDTSTDEGCLVVPQSSGPDLCVLYANQITVTGTLEATGGRPLVLAATTTVVVNGRVDVSSVRGGRVGAGANDPACRPPTAAAASAGGAGGSLTGRGGNGGDGNGAAGTSGDAITTFTRVTGGCRGGASGGGPGGNGGGAVMLIAGVRIDVNGILVASGAGGDGGGGGGDGGGSGGFIGLDAPAVRVGMRVAANGGGGGGGDGTGAGGGGNGGNGRDDNAAALGGGAGGGSGGGAGGDGAADTDRVGAPGDNGSINGGGGGGSAGAIIVFKQAPESGGTYSPPYQIQP